MAVDYRLRRQWYTKQGRIPPERMQEIQKMLSDFDRRPGETDTEYDERRDRQSAEARAEFERRGREDTD
jgi:hypothetical protein